MGEQSVHDMTPEDKTALEELKKQIVTLQEQVDTLTSQIAELQLATKKDSSVPLPSVDMSFGDAATVQSQPISATLDALNQQTNPSQQGFAQTPFGTQSGGTPQNVYGAPAPVVPQPAPAPSAVPVTPPSVDAHQTYGNSQGYSQPAYTAPVQWPNASGASHKDHVAAALLAIFLGVFGVHKFYLGYNTAGFIMLAVSLLGVILFFVPSVVVWLIGVIEGIVYLMKSQEEFDYLYVRNKRLWF